MVISVFSKPKLHKILPPLVWDKEMLTTTTHNLSETRIHAREHTHTQTCAVGLPTFLFQLNLQLQKMYTVKEPTSGFVSCCNEQRICLL